MPEPDTPSPRYRTLAEAWLAYQEMVVDHRPPCGAGIMTDKELRQKMDSVQVQRIAALEAVYVFATSILPLLKDQKLDNVARELGAKLFVVESLVAEMSGLVRSDPGAVMRVISEHMRGKS